jgi:hypothetical protein
MKIFAFVDDMQSSSHPDDKPMLDDVVAKLVERFQIKCLGLTKWFLGMRVTHGIDGTIKIDHAKYITDMATRFGLNDGENVKTYTTPASTTSQTMDEDDRDGGGAPTNQQLYMELIGSLMYTAITTRLDITHKVCELARHTLSPCVRHYNDAMRVLRYLVGTKELGLTFRKGDAQSNINVEAWSDSDWAGDKSDRKSTTGWIVRINGNVISWQSKLQSNVAKSSSEAELYAADSAAAEVMYIRGMLEELKLINTNTHGPSLIHIDNQAAMKIAQNSIRSSERTKHIDVRYYWITSLIEQNNIKMKWIETQKQLADIFTKSLGQQPFIHLRKQLMS